MSSKLHQLVLSWRPLANYAVKAGVVCLQVKLCDPHLSALELRFSRRGAIQIYVYVYLYLLLFMIVCMCAEFDWFDVWPRVLSDLLVPVSYC